MAQNGGQTKKTLSHIPIFHFLQTCPFFLSKTNIPVLSFSMMQYQPTHSFSHSLSTQDKTTETMSLRRLEQEQEKQSSSVTLLPSSFNDEKLPILSKDSNFVNSSFSTSTQNQQRRRKGPSNASFSPQLSRQQSFRRDVGHAAAETFLLTRLTFTLLRYLGVGYRWIIKFLALGCYAMLLMPGFLQVGYYYFFSSQVRRSIVYGEQPRNRLDLYLPVNCEGQKPVVAFVTGGAWIIGYKAWGSLLGRRLAERDVIVACIDYRNFPQGTISDMVKDTSEGISYVCNNIAEYGGDPNRIYLVGQSAGAHIAACALMEQAIKECDEGESVSWSVSQIKAYFGISGGYNIFNLVDHFHGRGLYRSVFLSIMEGMESLRRFSPEVMVQDPIMKNAVSLLPRIVLLHGTSDYSIPSDARCYSCLCKQVVMHFLCSETFADALQRVGAQVELILYKGKTHTDLFLQDPLRGGKDELLEDLLSIIHAGDTEAPAKNSFTTPIKRLVPEFMLQLARKISPF
ncbi:hypothetical protein IFM89_030715 [Coptis chinensis]|uniref:protein-S-isoprenylcysteine alpha-carbonyl methylesterase n=1 Tax=Coptis chinensis TaxID=261450 RepID=A0A835MDU7_9MAGN|nr:hypothetical protein IFM89_030715 [Coptis chinensis]